MLRDGLVWHHDQIEQAAGEAIEYKVGNRTWPMTGVPITAEREVVSAEGLATLVYEISWSVSQDALDTRRIKPAPGHRIVHTASGAIFELLPKAGRVVEPLDQLGMRILLHTSRVQKPTEQVA